MAIVSNLIGTYSNQISGMTRTLTINKQDNATLTFSGTWASSINGVPTTFAVSGQFLPSPGTPYSNALFFSLSGSAQVADPRQQPPIMRSMVSLVGFAEVSGPGDVDRLNLTIAWAEDNPGNLKQDFAWTNQHVIRQ